MQEETKEEIFDFKTFLIQKPFKAKSPSKQQMLHVPHLWEEKKLEHGSVIELYVGIKHSEHVFIF